MGKLLSEKQYTVLPNTFQSEKRYFNAATDPPLYSMARLILSLRPGQILHEYARSILAQSYRCVPNIPRVFLMMVNCRLTLMDAQIVFYT